MDLDARQRRDLISLWCRVAWADGIVQDSERDRLRALLARLGADAVTSDELEVWLRNGPPEVSAQLPPEARKLFLDEAVRIVSADQDVDPEEVRAIRGLLDRYFVNVEDILVG